MSEKVPQIPCAIYARYSSRAQRDVSIEQQVEDCERYCEQNGLKPVAVYADRHLSGTSDARPQFQKMIEDSARSVWKTVVCWKVDRFARDRYDSAHYKHKLKKNGVTVQYAKETIPEGPEGILLESFLEGAAEYYSKNLAQNTRRGMNYNAEQCKVNGLLPFGYINDGNGHWMIDEDKARTVKEIYHRFLAGEGQAEIIHDLNGRRVKASRGREWQYSSIHNVLTNPAYIGTYHFGEIVKPGGVPAIIEETDYMAAQEIFKQNRRPLRRQHEDDPGFLLTGKLFCGECGEAMVGTSGRGHGGNYHYYSCRGRLQKKCDKANVRRDYIEAEVLAAAREIIMDDDTVNWIADKVIEYQQRRSDAAEVKTLQAELKDIDKEIEGLTKAAAFMPESQAIRDALAEKEKDRRDTDLQIRLAKKKLTEVDRDFVRWWLCQFREGDMDDPAFRKKLIDTFVSAIWLYDDHLTVTFNYSGDRATVDRKIIQQAESGGGFAQDIYRVTTHELCEPRLIFLGRVFATVRQLQ